MKFKVAPGRIELFLLLLLIVATLWLRLSSLGYSDYQGDEIKAFCRPEAGQNLADFLLGQRKGPVQFLIACATSAFDPGYSNAALIRLPFAIASVLAVFTFYLLVKMHFGNRVGLYSALLMATNGFFVGFGRIVQYQSITIMCTVAALYFLTLAGRSTRWKLSGLYIASALAAIGILAHFDGVFVIPPALYLVLVWFQRWKKETGTSTCWKHLFFAAGLSLGLLAVFYLPYALSLSSYQVDYWSERIYGTTTSSVDLFRLTNPLFVFPLYLALAALSLVRVRWNDAYRFLALWFLPAFFFMAWFMKDSRSHIYTFLIPLMILVALGIETVEIALQRLLAEKLRWLPQLVGVTLFILLSFMSYTLFVDHQREYPWESKRFLLWELESSKLQGMMGFPYRREWSAIGELFRDMQKDDEIWFTTNEKLAIVEFYLPENMRFQEIKPETVEQMKEDQSMYAIVIERPQSFLESPPQITSKNWRSTFTPIQTFTDENDRLLASVYHLAKKDLESILSAQ